MLLFEEDRVAGQALQFLLEDEGMTVHAAAAGSHLSSLVRELRPDVLILGVRTPTVKALEMARDGRSAQPELPVVVISAADSVDQALGDFLIDGRVAYLRKPIDFQALLWVVDGLRGAKVEG